MYVLGDIARSLPNMAFMGVGIWMAHSFYRTSRKGWQAAVVWALCILFCGVGASTLWNSFDFLHAMPYERLSMFVGFSCILAYLYLFPGISIWQRIFTYFFVDNSMYLMVIISRYVSVFLLNWFEVWPDLLFVLVYAILISIFCAVFAVYLRKRILKALIAFQNQMKILSFFSLINYAAAIGLADPWGPMDPVSVWRLMRILLCCVVTISGYYIAFRTLLILQRNLEAVKNEQMLVLQMAQSEQYYSSFMENMEKVKALRHDTMHHIHILSGLCSREEWALVRDYVNQLAGEEPVGQLKTWCGNYTVNVLLDYFSAACENKGIKFSCHAAVGPECGVEPLHLCSIIGNGLQNAVDACLRMEETEPGFIDFHIRERGGKLALIIRNSFDGRIGRDEGGELISRKDGEGHGIGLASIRRTVGHYGGYCSAGAKGGEFVLKAILEFNKKSQT